MAKRRWYKRFQVVIVLLLVGIIGIAFSISARNNIIEFVSDYTHSTVETEVMSILESESSNAVYEFSKKYGSDFENIEYDSNGDIMLISLNMVLVNMLENEICTNTYKKLDEYCTNKELYAPIGVVLGSVLFSGEGKLVDIDIVPVGLLTINYDSIFKSEGINQTLHTIYINLEATVSLVLPFYTEDVKVEANILLHESLIVGEIPKYYLTGDI